MSDLLKYAELELEHERAEAAAKQFAADQKRANDLRSKAVSALRQFLPKDRVWEIEPLGPVEIEENWHGYGWHYGLELTVDELTFGYAEVRSYPGGPAEKTDQLFLRRVCDDCGAPVWTRVNKIVDLAREPIPCPACERRKNEEQTKNDAAVSLAEEGPGGRWLTISWEGQITTGKNGQ